MVQVVIIKNPFQPYADRVIKHFPYGFTARQIINSTDFKGVEINCVVNGETVEMADDYVIPDNQIVVISAVVGKGRGGKILGMVVGIALMVVGGLAAGGAIFGLTAGTTTAALVGMGFGLAGSLLMGYSQSAYAKSIGASNYETSTNDATYSWSGVQTMEGQNNPITLTYGKVKSGGQTIGKYIDVRDNKEYLNWLVSAGEGELSITDVKLNDNAVSYYNNVTVETRSGTNDQTVISNFNDTYFTKELGYQLLETERIDTAQGNATQGLKFEVEFSNGLYYANDKGGLDTAWVDIYAEYRIKNGNWNPIFYSQRTNYSINGGPGGISVNGSAPTGNYRITYRYDYEDMDFYVQIYYPNGNVEKGWVSSFNPVQIGDFTIDARNIPHYVTRVETDEDGDQYTNRYANPTYSFSLTSNTYSYASSTRISAAQSSALRREYRKDGLTAGEYEVRLKVTGRSHAVNNSRASVRCYWKSITSIVYDDFSYPNIALIGIKALATDQISGSPQLTFMKERSKVWVFNPNTNNYEQKPANNPAWACYDMLHLASRLKNINTNKYEFDVRGVPANHIIYDQFKEWADFCNAQKLYVNIEVTQCGEMLETINGQVALIGRGTVLRFGTRYGCTWKCVKQPTQMFGMGNIVSGTLQEEFLQTSDRANCVELTYTDANMDYERNVITVYSDNYDTDAEEKISQATYNGITSYSQAYREAKFLLYCNKYMLRTVSFEANVDAIACTVGDVVLVSHDVPYWANSGRIHEVDVANNTLLLPIEIKNQEGQYRIMYRTVNDNIYTSNVSIISNADGWCKIHVNTPFKSNDLPQANDIFDIAKSVVGSKPFVVNSISRASDFTRKIECIEYNENVYKENYTIPSIDYSVYINNVTDVKSLVAVRTKYVDINGNYGYRINVSWERTCLGTYSVYYSKDKTNWILAGSGVKDEQYSFTSVNNMAYIKVVTANEYQFSKGTICTVSNLDYTCDLFTKVTLKLV